MRSIWERNYARYLEFLRKRGEIAEWEYEPHRFLFEGVSFGNRTYLPDFRITENNGEQHYVEIKGFMDRNSRVKLKRMKKYFPEVIIDLVDKTRYAEIAKWQKLIGGWETDQVSKKVLRQFD